MATPIKLLKVVTTRLFTSPTLDEGKKGTPGRRKPEVEEFDHGVTRGHQKVTMDVELEKTPKGCDSHCHHVILEEMEQRHREEMGKLKKLYEDQIARVMQENKGLIEEILQAHQTEIKAWKWEYEQECLRDVPQGDPRDFSEVMEEVNPAGVLVESAKPGFEIARKLLIELKDLNPIAQGLMVAGIGIGVLLIGCYSWPFIQWAWPKLLAFATDARVIQSATWILAFIQSGAYEDIMSMWKKGELLLPVLFQNFGQDILSILIQFAPKLFGKIRMSLTSAKL